MTDVIGKVLSEPWRLRALAAMNGITEDEAEDVLYRLREQEKVELGEDKKVELREDKNPPAQAQPAKSVRFRPPRPSLRMREAILRRDGYTCQQCGASPKDDPQVVLEVDHKYPVAFGGSNQAINLQVLCRPCNRKKSFDWKEEEDG